MLWIVWTKFYSGEMEGNHVPSSSVLPRYQNVQCFWGYRNVLSNLKSKGLQTTMLLTFEIFWRHGEIFPKLSKTSFRSLFSLSFFSLFFLLEFGTMQFAINDYANRITENTITNQIAYCRNKPLSAIYDLKENYTINIF